MTKSRHLAANIRKLAAIDIVFLGFKLVLAEYICGIVLPLGLGILALIRGRSAWQYAVGAYLACLGINYVPMLANTISLASRENARAELGDELTERRQAMSKYRRISLLLLVPLLLPVVAAAPSSRHTGSNHS